MNTALRTCHLTAITVIGLSLALSFAQPVRADELNTSATVETTQSGSSGKPTTGAAVIDRLKATRPLIPRPAVHKPSVSSTTRPCLPMNARVASSTVPCVPMQGGEWKDASNTPDGSRWAEIASTTRAHFQEQIQRFAKVREDNLQKREDRLSKIEKRVSNINYGAIKSILERLGNAHDNLSKLLSKIEDSLAKATAAGKDVTAAQSAVDTAEADLTAAQTAIDTVTSVIDTATASSTKPKDHIDDIRKAVTAATDAIKKAQASILAAVQAARSAVGSGGQNSQSQN